MVPVEMSDDTLDVAFATFEDTLMVDELQLLTGLTIRPMIAPLSVVEKTLERSVSRQRAPSSSAIGRLLARRGGGRGRRRRRRQQDEEILEIDAAAAGRPGRPHCPHGQPDSRAGLAIGGQRHSHRALRGFLRHSAAGGRLAPRVGPAAAVAVRVHRLPLQDSGEDGHRREARAPGRRHRPADRRQADRPRASAPCPPCTAKRWSCESSTRAPFPSN